VVGDNSEKFKVEDVEIGEHWTSNSDLLEQGFTQDGNWDSLNLLEERHELSY